MENRTKIVTALATALILFSVGSATAADSANKTGFLPGTLDVEGVAGVGAAACADGVAPQIACGNGGVGVFFFFGTDLDKPANDRAQFSCDVRPNNDVFPGDVAVTCGVDRDDDTFITNVDTNGDQDDGGAASDDDHKGGPGAAAEYNMGEGDFEDDAYFSFVVGPTGGCVEGDFAHDAEYNVDGDHDWDTATVFLGVSATNDPSIGSAKVTLGHTTSASC